MACFVVADADRGAVVVEVVVSCLLLPPRLGSVEKTGEKAARKTPILDGLWRGWHI